MKSHQRKPGTEVTSPKVYESIDSEHIFSGQLKKMAFLIDGLWVNDAADHVGQQITITLAFVVR
jgi:hypothetical protein